MKRDVKIKLVLWLRRLMRLLPEGWRIHRVSVGTGAWLFDPPNGDQWFHVQFVNGDALFGNVHTVSSIMSSPETEANSAVLRLGRLQER